MALDKCIQYLDDNYAKMSHDQEIIDVQNAVEEAVAALLSKVASIDERFESKVESAGSFYEGTKIIKCDEFDFMVKLVRISGFCDLVYRDERKRLVVVRISSSTDEKKLLQTRSDAITVISSGDGPIFCLNGSNLKKKCYSLLREAFKSVKWSPNLKYVSSTGLFFDRLGLSGASQAAASEQLDFL